MKKILFVAFLSIMAFQFVKAQDVFSNDVQMLPEKGRSFLTEHFSTVKVSHLKKENELKDMLDKKKYEVTLTDGTKIEFDKDGNWMEVESHGRDVPVSVLPDKIRTYLTTHMSGQPVKQIEKKRRGYKIELANDLELTFDEQGNLTKMDD